MGDRGPPAEIVDRRGSRGISGGAGPTSALEGAAPVARIAVYGGEPSVHGFFEGGFIPLTPTPVTDFERLRRQRADLIWESTSPQLYLSSLWLRNLSAAARSTLEGWAAGLSPCPTPLEPGEAPEDLWWSLVATKPDGLTSGVALPGGTVFGCGDPGGLVLVRRRPDNGVTPCMAGGDPSRSLERISAWTAHWRSLGKPGLSSLRGTMERVTDGS